MKKMILMQPSEFTDQLTADGQELTKLPYPIAADEAGLVGNQDFWQGDPFRAIGFQRDLARHEIDVTWSEVFREPELAIGLYLVSADSRGNFGVHHTAIGSVEVLD